MNDDELLDLVDKNDNVLIDDPTKPVKFIKLSNWQSYQQQKHHFSFTILRHPIHLFYSQYYALKAEHEIPKASWRSLQYDKNSFINALIKQCQSINQFIDIVLDIGPSFFCFIFPKGYFPTDTLNQLDFVGVVDYLKESWEIISKKVELIPYETVEHINKQEYDHDFSYRHTELSEFFKEEISVYEHIKGNFEQTYIKGLKVLMLSNAFDYILEYLESINGLILHKEAIFNTYDVIFINDVDQINSLESKFIIVAYKKIPRSIKGYVITFRVKIDDTTFVHYAKEKRDVTFIIQGSQNLNKLKYQHCIYGLFGNIELSTWDLYDESQILQKIAKDNIVNKQNAYLQMYTTKKGLERVSTPWVIKVRSDEIFSDWSYFITTMKSNPHKLTCSNIFFRKKIIRLHNSDHIMGSKKNTLQLTVTKCMENLEKGKIESINNMLLWLAPEVWITTSHLENLYGPEKTYMNLQIYELKLMMQESFHIVSVDTMGKYIISFMQNSNRREITRETKYRYRKDIFELNSILELE